MSYKELSDIVYSKDSKIASVLAASVLLKNKGVVLSLDSRHSFNDDPILLVDNFWDCECERDYIHSSSVCECERCGLTEIEAPRSRLNELCDFLDKE